MAFTVTLVGGAPWGFRIQGGNSQPIKISRINPGSKAAQQGVKEGDVVEAINGQPTSTLSQNESHQLIRNSLNCLQLTLRRDEIKGPRMFKSSKSIEVNGNTTNGVAQPSTTIPSSHSTTIIVKSAKERKGSKEIVIEGERPIDSPRPGDPKGNAVTTPPISITVSSSKKAACSPTTMEKQDDGPSEQATPGAHVEKSPPEQQLEEPVEDASIPAVTSTAPAVTTSSTITSSSSPIVASSSVDHTTDESQGVWSPGQPPPPTTVTEEKKEEPKEGEITPVWKPFGGVEADQPQYRSVRLETTTEKRMESSSTELQVQMATTPTTPTHKENYVPKSNESSVISPKSPEIPTKATDTVSHVSPTFTRLNGTSHLPRSQSPTITLLQKAREGQIPKGAVYIDHKMDSKESSRSALPKVNDNLFRVQMEEMGDAYKKITLTPIRHEGIGPTEQGVPISLRTTDLPIESKYKEGIKEENKGEWYKRMYKSLHRLGDSSEGRIPYSSSGYMSEPEPEREDLQYYSKYATLDRRRPRFNEFDRRPQTASKVKPVLSSWTPPSAKYSPEVYRNQPRRIEDYEPGYSSIAEREAKLEEEVDQQGNRHNHPPERPHPSYLFKDGYESDSTLVYRKHGSECPTPLEQRVWYREIQKGGDIPVSGLRRAIPDRPKEPPYSSASLPRLMRSQSAESAASRPIDLRLLPPVPPPPPKVPLVDMGSESPHKYLESEVNIHYRAPIRTLEKEYIDEDELRRRQEELMKQFYEEEKRKKYLQELTDIENRRHTDNFIPSQKSPIPLNRYDNPFDESISPQPRIRTPEPKTVARALYNFTAQSAKELTFCKGDIIFITRRIDKNWYEGEHHGMIGLFPVNYVEIIPYDSIRLGSRKITEGQARAKYNFRAQTHLELPLVKGEIIVLTRRVDRNWYEGRIGNRRGIFPVSYVDVLIEPGEGRSCPTSPVPKPVASPVSRAMILNGSATSPQLYSYPQPSYYNQKLNLYQHPYATMRRYTPARPPEPNYTEKRQPLDQSLHIDTHSEPVPYRVLYDYQPQNEDELELRENDTVYVMEKCDDGWYVGSSLRTGLFGTFPGNYVERL